MFVIKLLPPYEREHIGGAIGVVDWGKDGENILHFEDGTNTAKSIYGRSYGSGALYRILQIDLDQADQFMSAAKLVIAKARAVVKAEKAKERRIAAEKALAEEQEAQVELDRVKAEERENSLKAQAEELGVDISECADVDAIEVLVVNAKAAAELRAEEQAKIDTRVKHNADAEAEAKARDEQRVKDAADVKAIEDAAKALEDAKTEAKDLNVDITGCRTVEDIQARIAALEVKGTTPTREDLLAMKYRELYNHLKGLGITIPRGTDHDELRALIPSDN